MLVHKPKLLGERRTNCLLVMRLEARSRGSERRTTVLALGEIDCLTGLARLAALAAFATFGRRGSTFGTAALGCATLATSRLAAGLCAGFFLGRHRLCSGQRARGMTSPLFTPTRSLVPSLSIRAFTRVGLPVLESSSITFEE